MEYPAINYQLLDRTLEWVEEEATKPFFYELSEEDQLLNLPTRHWNQQGWFDPEFRSNGAVNMCGTTRCFAGQAAIFAGWAPAYTVDYKGHVKYTGTFFQTAMDVGRLSGQHGEGRTSHPEEVATKELGLTSEEAWALFRGDNDLSMLKTVVEKIKNGEYRHPRPEIIDPEDAYGEYRRMDEVNSDEDLRTVVDREFDPNDFVEDEPTNQSDNLW